MDTPTRRLAAVWFADIVGYSALASRDEVAALKLLRTFQRVSRASIDRHRGRLVQFIGDAAFAEFPSTDAAVRAALSLRSGLPGAWARDDLEGRVRVGLHVCDVAQGEDGDLHGDGVNVAARLCDAAGEGQVLVSQDVWRQLRQLRDLHFTPAGRKRLKGVAVPVEAYAANFTDALDAAGAAPEAPGRTRHRWLRGAAAALAVASAVTAWGWAGDLPSILFPSPAAAAPDPAVAVLPLDTTQGLWAEGLPELLALAMDGVAGIRVMDPRVVRSRAAGQPGDSASAVRVGASLGARYAAVGSLETAGDSVALRLDVYEIATGARVRRVESRGTTDRIPMLVEAVAAELVNEAFPEAGDLDTRFDWAVTASVPALSRYLEGMRELRRGNWAGALRSFDAAVAEDPDFALARYRLAFVRVWTMPPHVLFQDPDTRRAAEQSASLPERERLMVNGYYQTHFRLPEAVPTLTRLTTLYPDDAEGWFLLGDALYHLDPDGSRADFRSAFDRALELAPDFSPAYPHLVEDALDRGDSAAVRDLVARYRVAEPSSPLLPGLEWAVRITRQYAGPDTQALTRSPAEEEFRVVARTADLARRQALDAVHPEARHRIASLDSAGAVAAATADAGRFEDASLILGQVREGFGAVTRDSEALREMDRLATQLQALDDGSATGALWDRGRSLVADAQGRRRRGELADALDGYRRAVQTLTLAAEAPPVVPEPVRPPEGAGTLEGDLRDPEGDGGSANPAQPADPASSAPAGPAAAAEGPDARAGAPGPADSSESVLPADAVAAALASLEAAIEAERLDRVHEAWPGMSGVQADGLQRLFDSVRDLDVTFHVRSVHRRGDGFLAEVDMEYAFYSEANRRDQTTDASLVFQVERRGDRWVIVGSGE